MQRFRTLFRSAIMCSAVPITAGLALAALAPAANAESASGTTVGEVVVTAQFREQNLQQTPLAITAVNSQMLEARSQTNLFQVAAEAPNVSLRPAGGGSGSAMVAFIRGVGQTDFNFSQEPGVAIYVDDVYYSTLTGSLLDLMDLDRVEVLRGPQGTLAGRNSIGGAIKLFSKKPTGDGSGYVEGTYGSLNRIDFKGGTDLTIVPDKLFLRISGATRHHDGYVTRVDYKCTHPSSPIRTFSVGTGCQLGTEGGQSFDAIKAALRWLPSENVEINVAADATNDQSPVQAGTLLWARPNGLSLDGVPYDARFVTSGPNRIVGEGNHPFRNYATYIDPGPPGGGDGKDAGWKPVVVDPINHYRTWGVSGTIDWKLSDNFSLKSITSYRKFYNSFAQDTSASPVGVEILLQTLHHSQVTQEFRLNGSLFNNTVDFTLGGFYASQNGDEEARVDLPYVGAGAVPGSYNFDFDFIHGPDTTPSESKAGFMQVDWHPTSRLDIIGGVRYSDDSKTYTYHRHNPDGSDVCAVPNFAGPAGCPNWLVFGLNGKSSTYSGHRWDYRGDINYKFTDNLMVYAQISTGYKGGGANARPFYGGPPGPTCAVATCQITTFNPETLTAYEAGFKSQFFDRRVRFNAAGFINKYNDIILTLGTCPLNTPGGAAAPCAMPQNVGSADVKGFELETEAHPFGGLELDASLSYLNFQYTNTNFASTGVSIDAVPPYSPKWKWNVGVQYVFDTSVGWSITPRIDLSHQSDVFTTATNTPLDQDPSRQVITVNGSGLPINHPDRISGYTLANARITWRNPDAGWQASFEVTNFTDKLYYLTYFDQAGAVGYLGAQPAMGRQWAVTVKKTF